MVTIPNALMDYILKVGVQDLDPNAYVFGKGISPNIDLQCGTNSLNNFHRSILLKLKLAKKISNTEGLSIYSWKDTGALELIRKGIDILQIKNQMRHTSLETTQQYIKSLKNVNEGIKVVADTLPLTTLALQSRHLNDRS